MSIINEQELEKKVVSIIKERLYDNLNEYRKDIRESKNFYELRSIMEELVDDLIHINRGKGWKNTSTVINSNVRTARQQRRYEAKLNRQANKEGNTNGNK